MEKVPGSTPGNIIFEDIHIHFVIMSLANYMKSLKIMRITTYILSLRLWQITEVSEAYEDIHIHFVIMILKNYRKSPKLMAAQLTMRHEKTFFII